MSISACGNDLNNLDVRNHKTHEDLVVSISCVVVFSLTCLRLVRAKSVVTRLSPTSRPRILRGPSSDETLLGASGWELETL